jgi:hypothetical protein
MIMHVEGAGGSAHSTDNGTSWHFDRKEHAYEYAVTLRTTGQQLSLTNREEPKVLLDEQGMPTHLINQAALRSLEGPKDNGSPRGCLYEGAQSTHLTFVLMQPISRTINTMGVVTERHTDHVHRNQINGPSCNTTFAHNEVLHGFDIGTIALPRDTKTPAAINASIEQCINACCLNARCFAWVTGPCNGSSPGEPCCFLKSQDAVKSRSFPFANNSLAAYGIRSNATVV